MKEEMTAVSFDSWKTPITDETPTAIRCLGIKALMLAMLEDAIHCLSSSQILVRTKAEYWIASREHHYVFSFAVICETLGLEPSRVRRSVMGLVDDKRTGGHLLKRSRPNGRQSASMQLLKRRPHHEVLVARRLARGQAVASKAMAVDMTGRRTTSSLPCPTTL